MGIKHADIVAMVREKKIKNADLARLLNCRDDRVHNMLNPDIQQGFRAFGWWEAVIINAPEWVGTQALDTVDSGGLKIDAWAERLGWPITSGTRSRLSGMFKDHNGIDLFCDWCAVIEYVVNAEGE